MSLRRVLHLVRGFARALHPLPPRRLDVAWVASVLRPGELEIWITQQRVDRRESIGVARRTQRLLAVTPHAGDDVWTAAALLHDVGKQDSRLGPVGRSLATLAAAIGGADVVAGWAGSRGLKRRIGLYVRHPEIGADRVRIAGGREEAAVWAAAHHRPETWEQIPIPAVVIDALARADGELPPSC